MQRCFTDGCKWLSRTESWIPGELYTEGRRRRRERERERERVREREQGAIMWIVRSAIIRIGFGIRGYGGSIFHRWASFRSFILLYTHTHTRLDIRLHRFFPFSSAFCTGVQIGLCLPALPFALSSLSFSRRLLSYSCCTPCPPYYLNFQPHPSALFYFFESNAIPLSFPRPDSFRSSFPFPRFEKLRIFPLVR